MDGDIYVVPYFPDGVQHIITTGGNHYIGFVNESTILKYPHFKGTRGALSVELEILQRLGKHPHIIELKGEHEDGLLLEYAPNGSLERLLQGTEVTVKEKIRFARETAEGVAYVHQKNVLICDIHVRNILLDAKFHVKLCDFQGRLLGPDGAVLLSGGASENAESFMPRCDQEFADVKTDIFALGSTIYHIMAGHRPFPQYDTIDDEAKFVELYRMGAFPTLDAEECGKIVQNCWAGKYQSASEVVDDFHILESSLFSSSPASTNWPIRPPPTTSLTRGMGGEPYICLGHFYFAPASHPPRRGLFDKWLDDNKLTSLPAKIPGYVDISGNTPLTQFFVDSNGAPIIELSTAGLDKLGYWLPWDAKIYRVSTMAWMFRRTRGATMVRPGVPSTRTSARVG